MSKKSQYEDLPHSCPMDMVICECVCCHTCGFPLQEDDLVLVRHIVIDGHVVHEVYCSWCGLPAEIMSQKRIDDHFAFMNKKPKG
jgi:hypothetical protein